MKNSVQSNFLLNSSQAITPDRDKIELCNSVIEHWWTIKLKLKEAKDSGLFEGFSIATPEFHTNRVNYKPRFHLPEVKDPAILGITKDNRMYMIAWWDEKRDIDRVKMNIKKFKKFKIA
jgi:hypothetical protein